MQTQPDGPDSRTEPLVSDRVSWVLLTLGSRSTEVAAAIHSLEVCAAATDIVLVLNGCSELALADTVRQVRLDANVGVPAGRDVGAAESGRPLIGFLDDDAVLLTGGAGELIEAAFDSDPMLAVVGFRIQDDHGASARRHVPRIGGASSSQGGIVATFLGGACAIRRSAYDEVGGYWGELFFAHEELDLAWRLQDAGYRISYDPRIEVFHPRTPISRHGDGWYRTGRNRVMVARRNLPWPIAAAHVVAWFIIGVVRAPGGACRAAYVRGWARGWGEHVERRPMRWRTVYLLARRGRVPLL